MRSVLFLLEAEADGAEVVGERPGGLGLPFWPGWRENGPGGWPGCSPRGFLAAYRVSMPAHPPYFKQISLREICDVQSKKPFQPGVPLRGNP